MAGRFFARKGDRMTDITPIIEGIIALFGALISVFFIPWLRHSTTEKERAELLKWAEIAVAAAQQLYYGASGEKRKRYVQDFLTEQGYDVNDAAVDSAIEAAVLKLHRELEAAA